MDYNWVAKLRARATGNSSRLVVYRREHGSVRLGQQLLESGVLLLHVLHLLGHHRVHAAVLGPPAVVRLLTDAQLPADLWHLQAFASMPRRPDAVWR